MPRILQKWVKEFGVDGGSGEGKVGDGSSGWVWPTRPDITISAAFLSLGTLGFWKLFLKKGVSLLKRCENLLIL